MTQATDRTELGDLSSDAGRDMLRLERTEWALLAYALLSRDACTLAAERRHAVAFELEASLNRLAENRPLLPFPRPRLPSGLA